MSETLSTTANSLIRYFKHISFFPISHWNVTFAMFFVQTFDFVKINHLSACYRLTVQSMPVACLSTNRGYWVVYSLLRLYCMNNVVSLFNCFVLWIFYCFPNLLYAAEKPERWTFAGNSGGQSEDPRSPLSDRNTSTSVMYKADGKGSSNIRQEPRCEFHNLLHLCWAGEPRCYEHNMCTELFWLFF